MESRDLEMITSAFIASILLSLGLESVTDIDYRSLITFLEVGYDINVFADFHLLKHTTDYKEINGMYDEVLDRTHGLINDFGFTNPVEIFALYVYLLRSGYLSYDGNFVYDPKLKDLPGMLGVDVICGRGVCRSVSSNLTDLYNRCGFNATNVTVHTTSKINSGLSKLCPISLKRTEKHKTFLDGFFKFLDIIPVANHQITSVNDGQNLYVLDPTNDGILYCDTPKELRVPGTDLYMKYNRLNQGIMSLLGMGNYRFDPTDKKEKYSEVDFEKFKTHYLTTLKMIRENAEYLKYFYNKNKGLYNDINALVREQRGMIERLVPVVPKKLKKIVL